MSDGALKGLQSEDAIPPEYRGQTWEQRDPHAPTGTIQSRFPPAAVGNPAEPFGPFDDFREYHGRRIRDSCARGTHASLSLRGHSLWLGSGGIGKCSWIHACHSGVWCAAVPAA